MTPARGRRGVDLHVHARGHRRGPEPASQHGDGDGRGRARAEDQDLAATSTSGRRGYDSTSVDILKPGTLVVKEGNQFAYPGDTVTFTFAVTNNGNAPLSERRRERRPLRAGDRREARRTDDALDPGEKWMFTCSKQIPADHEIGDENPIRNVAIATGQGPVGQDGDEHRRSRRARAPSGGRHREDGSGDRARRHGAGVHADGDEPGRRGVRLPGGRRDRSALRGAAGGPEHGLRRDAGPARSGRHVDLHVHGADDGAAGRDVREHRER